MRSNTSSSTTTMRQLGGISVTGENKLVSQSFHNLCGCLTGVACTHPKARFCTAR